jgi:hypothetical protein
MLSNTAHTTEMLTVAFLFVFITLNHENYAFRPADRLTDAVTGNRQKQLE